MEGLILGTKILFMANYKKQTITREVEEHRAAFSLAFFMATILAAISDAPFSTTAW